MGIPFAIILAVSYCEQETLEWKLICPHRKLNTVEKISNWTEIIMNEEDAIRNETEYDTLISLRANVRRRTWKKSDGVRTDSPVQIDVQLSNYYSYLAN